ncbi:MAG: toxin-antitoxin system YwqK family antitoxin [Myxococcales bacterium]
MARFPSWQTALICVVPAALCSAAARADQCTFIARTGAKVSPRSGNCSLDTQSIKNGREVCTREGRTISETTFRAGEPQGPGWYTDYNNQRFEVRWKGETVDGPVKVFDKTGALECTMTVVNGKTEGVVRELWPGGQLKRAILFKGGEESGPKVGLLQDGRPFELTCGESSFTPEDRKLCGFEGGVSTVQFVQPDGRPRAYQAKYRAGQLLEEATVDEQGRPMLRKHTGDRVDVTRKFENGQQYRTYSTVKGDYDGDFKEWNKDGRLVEESKYVKGRIASRTRYYLNGKPKQELTVDPKTGVISLKDFYDTGTMKKTGTYQPCRNDRCLDWPTPDGTVREFAEDGRLEMESQYAGGELNGVQRVFHRNGKPASEETFAQGKPRKLRCWASDGKVQLEEEYFEDGSRKSASPASSREERARLCRPES